MDTNRIRYFLSLAQTGSITKAADLHHISPPAFSKAMKIFEQEVGRKLTIPHGRGILLTDSAKGLVPSLEAIIRQIEAVKSGVESNGNDKAAALTLKIATFEIFSTYFMSRVLAEDFNKYQCTLREMIPGQMEESVSSGESDLALTYLPIPRPNLDFLKIQEIQMGIFGCHRDIKNFDHENYPFAAPVAVIEGSPTRVRGLDGWPDNAYPRNIIYRVQMLETALGLCRQGMAVAFIPKFIARLHNEIVQKQFQIAEIPLPHRFPKEKNFVYIVKRKSDREGFAAKRIAAALRRICKEV